MGFVVLFLTDWPRVRVGIQLDIHMDKRLTIVKANNNQIISSLILIQCTCIVHVG